MPTPGTKLLPISLAAVSCRCFTALLAQALEERQLCIARAYMTFGAAAGTAATPTKTAGKWLNTKTKFTAEDTKV